MTKPFCLDTTNGYKFIKAENIWKVKQARSRGEYDGQFRLVQVDEKDVLVHYSSGATQLHLLLFADIKKEWNLTE